MSRILSQEHIDMACEMRERGLSYQQIANKIAVAGAQTTASNIAYICLRRGADLPAERRRKSSYGAIPGSIRKRGNHVVRQFTAEEDELLRSLDRQGLRICDICRRMNRRANSIIARLATLARHEARAEQ